MCVSNYTLGEMFCGVTRGWTSTIYWALFFEWGVYRPNPLYLIRMFKNNNSRRILPKSNPSVCPTGTGVFLKAHLETRALVLFNNSCAPVVSWMDGWGGGKKKLVGGEISTSWRRHAAVPVVCVPCNILFLQTATLNKLREKEIPVKR